MSKETKGWIFLIVNSFIIGALVGKIFGFGTWEYWVFIVVYAIYGVMVKGWITE